MIHAVKVHDFVKDEAKAPGKKVLVDRLWPRGVAKDDLDCDEWFKEVAPSAQLRKWFGHDPDKFDEFTNKYRAELDSLADAPSHPTNSSESTGSQQLEKLRTWARNGALTLFYGAADREVNHAVVLKEWLDESLS